MKKALREAKVSSSWINPNPAYEEGTSHFIEAILTPGPVNQFLRHFIPIQRQIADYGFFTSLSQALLKITSPGIPDFYQGSELWDLHLVDPDNRRPVDYEKRTQMLSALKRETEKGSREALVRELVADRADGRIKLFLVWQSLTYRRRYPLLFQEGEYMPLEVRGRRARNVCAFARRKSSLCILVVVPRFLAALLAGGEEAPVGEDVWGDAVLVLPDDLDDGGPFLNIFTDQMVHPISAEEDRGLPLAGIFSASPFAILERHVP